MTVSRFRPLVLAALAFAAAGCDQGRENPPDTVVRVVNVAPNFPSLIFAREQSSGDELVFRAGTEHVYDQDTYDFNVAVRDIPTGGTTLKRTFALSVESGTLYTFVLTQSGSGVQEVILQAQPPAANATDAQVLAVHAAEGAATMDVFLEAPGADIAGASPWGSVDFLGTLAPRSVAAGEYQVTLTPAGDRATVLYRSQAFTLTAATSTTLVVTPTGGEGVAPLSVTMAQGTAVILPDQTSTAAVRVLNTATDGAPRDVAFNGEFSPPLFAAVPFAAPTPYLPIAAGAEVPVNVTPPGNPGVLELDQKVPITETRQHTLMITGATGALTHALSVNDGRRFFNEARLSFYNAAMQFTSLDLVVLPANADPATALAVTSVTANNVSTPISLIPGAYNAYLRVAGTTTVVAGPVPIELAAEGIYSVLATNGPDTTTGTLTLLDGFP